VSPTHSHAETYPLSVLYLVNSC